MLYSQMLLCTTFFILFMHFALPYSVYNDLYRKLVLFSILGP